MRSVSLFLSAMIAAGSAFSAGAADLWNGRGYVDNGVVVGGQYGVGLYQGTPPRYIDRYYADTGLRPYLKRYHNRYDDVPAVSLRRPDVPIVRSGQPRARIRAAEGNPSISGTIAGRHTQWCGSTYRSYRRSDNTFQPFDGPRRECASPYISG